MFAVISSSSTAHAQCRWHTGKWPWRWAGTLESDHKDEQAHWKVTTKMSRHTGWEQVSGPVCSVKKSPAQYVWGTLALVAVTRSLLTGVAVSCRWGALSCRQGLCLLPHLQHKWNMYQWEISQNDKLVPPSANLRYATIPGNPIQTCVNQMAVKRCCCQTMFLTLWMGGWACSYHDLWTNLDPGWHDLWTDLDPNVLCPLLTSISVIISPHKWYLDPTFNPILTLTQCDPPISWPWPRLHGPRLTLTLIQLSCHQNDSCPILLVELDPNYHDA